KEATDVSYLACARYLLSDAVHGHIFPQFASHNAHTVTAIANMATHQDYEFQRLYGMGDALYEHAMAKFGQCVRIYAPVGSHKDLLPYLVRRLLENGANSSFVHRLVDADCPIELLNQHPVDSLLEKSSLHNPNIPLPPQIFDDRKNSIGVNIDIESELTPFQAQVDGFLEHTWQACSVVNGQAIDESMIKGDQDKQTIYAPYDRSILVGEVIEADQQTLEQAIDIAYRHQDQWQQTPTAERATYLNQFADLLEANLAELVAICHKEAGKTIHDSIDEVREAVDFCRYYATQADLFECKTVPSPLGGELIHQRQALGVFACISPWNFPLAIFLGQITAALVAGNTVIAKPAEQTSIIAKRAHDLMIEAGFPAYCIQLVLGKGAQMGQALTSDARIAGVAFTGSTPTAKRIAQNLASRDVEPATLIAETGGQNAMIVDSTALPEQVVRDVLRSAFASAGQRCSALRVLYVQEDISQRVIELIQGAMEELNVGLPHLHATDVGPVIDKAAKQKLMQHINQMTLKHKLVAQLSLPEACEQGDYVAPTAIEIDDISVLEEEKFGPILHIVKYKAQDLPKVVESINSTGFGLTLGIHSRNETTYQWIEKQTRVGNAYINRDQVGAVVGVQPFGGQGLSGTGAKAGGPHYLYRFSKLTLVSQDKKAPQDEFAHTSAAQE
ncbi:MAG: bifunctional proline dehydrogenase/L-glutamate gamma-semialdehyde dehydrogenase PutA, partial [Vibrio sp.]